MIVCETLQNKRSTYDTAHTVLEYQDYPVPPDFEYTVMTKKLVADSWTIVCWNNLL